jgi:hypothetical protein
MKEVLQKLLQNLPQILQTLPSIVKYLPILLIIGAILFGLYFAASKYKDPYRCYDNEIYEQISVTSNVYKFKGGYCISDK